jgi:hypothetical protein
LKASLGKGKTGATAPQAAPAPAEPAASRRSAQKSATAAAEPKRARKR